MANRQAAHAVLVERRVLLGVTVLLALGLLLWVVAISTDYWGVVDAGNGVYMEKTKRFFLYSNTGIWRSCRTVYYNNTKPPTLKDYQRTVAAFSIISLLIMLMGFLFSLYTFPHTRYMYKRLAALSHVVSAGCALIVIEVAVTLFQYEAANLPNRHPPGSTWDYGYSFMLAWITFIAEVCGAIAFAVCSRKRKKDKAPDDQYAIEEEPTIIGR
ncbi:epithelial membrane protein 1-like isoform X2 [Macrobrachium nipponense]|uniref:epithelial membrane protein 1-like isoform X2 n=1 Tax=Macrobrachium nipponense TaxID=159736 RepID=UPI0030C8BDB5